METRQQKGEALYKELINYCKRTEEIAANYPWPAYAYAGFKFIDDAYRTMINFDPYGDYTQEFNEIKENCELLLNGLIAFRADKEK